MELLCATGFWLVIFINGQRLYAGDLSLLPKALGAVQSTTCVPWDSLPGTTRDLPVVVPVPQAKEVRV